MADSILITTQNQIATITFNRPSAMNALNDEMIHSLENITEQVKQDASIRAIILNGAGNLFMAGGDIQYFHQHIDELPKQVKKLIRTMGVSINNLMTMKKPVVASVHGAVAGVGMSFMLAADLVIAADQTKFTTAYSGIGISPDGGLSFTLPRTIGMKKAMELLLLGETFSAEKALQLGLINWIVAEQERDAYTQSLAARLTQGPAVAYANIKRLLNHSLQTDLANQLEIEAQAFADCAATQDFRQGVAAFLNKNKPVFKGE